MITILILLAVHALYGCGLAILNTSSAVGLNIFPYGCAVFFSATALAAYKLKCKIDLEYSIRWGCIAVGVLIYLGYTRVMFGSFDPFHPDRIEYNGWRYYVETDMSVSKSGLAVSKYGFPPVLRYFVDSGREKSKYPGVYAETLDGRLHSGSPSGAPF